MSAGGCTFGHGLVPKNLTQEGKANTFYRVEALRAVFALARRARESVLELQLQTCRLPKMGQVRLERSS